MLPASQLPPKVEPSLPLLTPFLLIHWTQIYKIFNFSTHAEDRGGKRDKGKMQAAASTPWVSCSPGVWQVLAFAQALGYTASDNHYFYIVVRPRCPSGIQTQKTAQCKVCHLTQLAHGQQATTTSLAPAETLLGTSFPQTHVQFTRYLMTSQYEQIAATRRCTKRSPVLTLQIILVNFFSPPSGMVWTNYKEASCSNKQLFPIHCHTSRRTVFRQCRYY